MIHAACRIVLGALFVFSGWTKIGDPLLLAYAIRAFELGWSDESVVRAAFVVPWTEVFAGASLLLGIRPKSGAIVAIFLLATFIFGIIALRVRGLDVDCPCFGPFRLFCAGPLGTCHVIRNIVFAGIGVGVLGTPVDRWTIDGVLSRRR